MLRYTHIACLVPPYTLNLHCGNCANVIILCVFVAVSVTSHYRRTTWCKMTRRGGTNRVFYMKTLYISYDTAWYIWNPPPWEERHSCLRRCTATWLRWLSTQLAAPYCAGNELFGRHLVRLSLAALESVVYNWTTVWTSRDFPQLWGKLHSVSAN
jgi:hypothetical protein